MAVIEMDVRELLQQELEELPEEGAFAVLDFVRFLKTQLTRLDAEERFDRLWLTARRIAREQGISDSDIAAEIKAVRQAL